MAEPPEMFDLYDAEGRPRGTAAAIDRPEAPSL